MLRKLRHGEFRLLIFAAAKSRAGKEVQGDIGDKARQELKIKGYALKGKVQLGSVLSAPEPEAMATANALLAAYGSKMASIPYDARLSGIAGNMGEDVYKDVIEQARRAYPAEGTEEASLEKYLFGGLCKKVVEIMLSTMGMRGAEVLSEIVSHGVGPTALVVSHGLGRIEMSVQALKMPILPFSQGMWRCEKIKAILPCTMVELIVNSSTGEVVEENYA